MKKLKIIIPVIVILIIAVIAAVVVFAGDKIAISDKSKVSMGLNKAYNSLEEVSSQLENMADYEFASKYAEKPVEAEIEFSMDAEIKNLEDLVGDEDVAESINSIIDSLSDVNITTKISMDSKKKTSVIFASLDTKDIIGKISGEVIDTPEKITVRSKELSDNYLVVDKKDAKKLDSTVEEMLDALEELYEKDFSKMKLTDDEIKHFKDKYKDIFENNLKDDMMASEKAEIEVSGSKKSCTKEVLTLNSENLRNIIKEYITTFEDDNEGREIIENKFNALYGKELAEEMIDELDEAIKTIKESIENIEGIEIKFNTYCSLFDVYAVEYVFNIDGEEVTLKQTFNKDNTEFVVLSDDTQYGKFVMTKENEGVKVDGNIEIDDIIANMTFIVNPTKIDVIASIEQDGESVGEFELAIDMNIKKNTEKEFEQDSKIFLSVDMPFMESDISGSITMNITEKLKELEELEVPNVKKALNMLDEKDLQKYTIEASKKLQEYMETFQKSDLYDAIGGLNGLSSLFSSKSVISDFDDEEEDDISDSKYEKNSLNEKELKKNISAWYKDNIKSEDGMTLTEIVEDNMIEDNDFDELVTTEIYTSWKKGATEDEGYLGIKVINDADEDDVYEFYVDIKEGKIFTEDNFTEDVDWKEFE